MSSQLLFTLCKNCMLAHKEITCNRCGFNNLTKISDEGPVSGSNYIITNQCPRRKSSHYWKTIHVKHAQDAFSYSYKPL